MSEKQDWLRDVQTSLNVIRVRLDAYGGQIPVVSVSDQHWENYQDLAPEVAAHIILLWTRMAEDYAEARRNFITAFNA